MGLTIHYELRLPGDMPESDVDQKIAALRARAIELSLPAVSMVHHADPAEDSETGNWIDFVAGMMAQPFEEDQHVGDPKTARGFLVNPGKGSEPATFGFLRRATPDGISSEWYWYCSCKTQYAANEGNAHFVFCHTAVVALLDFAVTLGIEATVADEGGFWETRSVDRLVEEVGRMNHLIAALAGKLSDALGPDRGLEAPIFEHPEFERLEMGE